MLNRLPFFLILLNGEIEFLRRRSWEDAEDQV